MIEAVTRRTVLAGIAAGAAALAGCSGTSGRSDDAPTFDGWLSNVDNYDGVLDRTGQELVTVSVGNGSAMTFEPPAVGVHAGTTVRWEWTGGGSAHNVAANDGVFGSPYHTETGATFEHTFETPGTVKYLCVPHEYAGMKGIVEVV